ncbi:hypothetical protein DH2020_009972 [Rehmannia glutinosa]|uniref:R2R3-MYB protein n=1 Tax=Rehmannia glutinosa TaxID=99300 RepID=A0ABR0X8E9_REHGL
MGRKPLDHKQKQKHKKGLWSPDEDQKLRNYIVKYGHGCWSSVPNNAVATFRDAIIDCRWSQMAHHLPGRTDNEIKNYWHSYLKKRVSKMVETEVQVKNECIMNEQQIQGLELSPSSLKPTPQDSSFESSENLEVSLTHTDQSMQQIENSRGLGQKCNLPKVLFAEWLSLDQFHGENSGSFGSSADFKYTLDNNNSNSEDSSVLLNEGRLATRCTLNPMAFMLMICFNHRSTLRMEV